MRAGLAWLAGFLVLHVLCSGVYVGTVGRRHRAIELDAELLRGKGPVSVLVAGSSHARNAVAAPRLGGLNVAVAGEHGLKTRHRLPWLLDRTRRPIGAVILEWDAASLSDWKVDDYVPEYVWGRYVPFLALGWERDRPFDYGGMWLKRVAMPYVGEGDNVANLLAGTRAFQDERDLDRLRDAPPKWMRRAGADAAGVHLAGHDPFAPALVAAWEELVADLRGRGLRVVMVSYPVSEEYAAEAERLGATRDGRRALLEPRLRPGEVDWIDLEDEYFGREGAFYDGDHLSGPARLHFTGLLAERLAALGIRVRQR